MRNFVIASLVLHAVILLLLAIGIPDPFKKTLKNEHPLLVDFVQISEQSSAPKLSPQQKIKEAKPKPVDGPKLEPIPEVVEDSKSTEAEKPKPEPEKPIEPKPEIKEEKKPEAEPVLKKKPETKKPEKKQEKKPEPKKPAPKKDKAKDKKKANKAEVNLKKDKATSKTDKKPDPKAKKAPKAALDDLLKEDDKDNDENESEEGAPSQSVGDVVTASEIDALRQHIRKCWVVPAGIKGSKDMTVDIKMEISKDGTVLKADIIDKKRIANDNAYRTAAESAQRAVLDPQCNPLPLPKDKYDQWKDLEFSFNPKDMY
jgi:outer membrane biosynthesis protein TonB